MNKYPTWHRPISYILMALAILLATTLPVTPTTSVKAVADQWDIACSDSPGATHNYLFGVAAQAKDAVVAVGSKNMSGQVAPQYQPLVELWRYDVSEPNAGPCFEEIPTPNPPLPGHSELYGIARVPSSAPADRPFWAVGYTGGTTRTWDPTIDDWRVDGPTQTLIEYFEGRREDLADSAKPQLSRSNQHSQGCSCPI